MTAELFQGDNHAAIYRKYRPKVSPLVISKILEFVKAKSSSSLQSAVDVACGSGQSTQELGGHFESVLGCDISEAQIDQAKKANSLPNITFCVADALHLPVEDNSVDLITCSNAAHWLDLHAFCKEVDRVLKPSGCLAVYAHLRNDQEFPHEDEQVASKLHEIYTNFRVTTLKDYWEVPIERHDAIYKEGLKVAYPDRERHVLYRHEDVSLSELVGYLESLSAHQTYHKKHPDDNILSPFQHEIMRTLGVDPVDKRPDEIILKTMCPIYLLLARKP